MAKARSSWRALRPVFLAGAATLTWLTFSSPAASADVLSDTTSLLGGVSSSVSSVTDKLAGSAPAAPAAPAVAAPSAGLLRPVVGQVSGLADNIVAAVPVVSQVVPAGAVKVIAAPIAGVADGATAAVVNVVVPPVAGAVPVLEPVVEPVADLVTGTAPLPVAVPELPVVVPELPVVPVDAGLSDGADLPGGSTDLSEGAVVPTRDEAVAEDSAALSGSTTLLGLAVVDAVQGTGSAGSFVGVVATAGTSSPLRAPAAAESDAGAGEPVTVDPSPVPAQAPAVPGSGTGSGTTASG
ncbi:hypothetical protein, partial [Arthrobacter sp. ZGTC412]|uniref:hypothetical protein n=1 Tax=Arthrobacter sp. ZGTC412 TaxID=2058900 RepID=UPI0011B0707A